MPTWTAALIAVAALTATYLACVRPALKGRPHCAATGGGQSPESGHQIAELRRELRVLRAQDALVHGRTPGRTS